jgi:hypothetical protein
MGPSGGTKRSGGPSSPARLAKVSKVACLAHTKLTFGRRVLCGCHAPLHDTRLQGGNLLKRPFLAAAGLASRQAQCGASLLPALLPAVRRRRVSVLDSIRWSPFGKVASNLPEFCGFPPLPDALVADVVRMARESEGTDARSTTQAQDIQPRPRRFVPAKARPTAGEKDRTSRASTNRGPSDVRGFLTADEAATT